MEERVVLPVAGYPRADDVVATFDQADLGRRRFYASLSTLTLRRR